MAFQVGRRSVVQSAVQRSATGKVLPVWLRTFALLKLRTTSSILGAVHPVAMTTRSSSTQFNGVATDQSVVAVSQDVTLHHVLAHPLSVHESQGITTYTSAETRYNSRHL